MTTAAGSLRQRHVDRTRSAIVTAALQLFTERGFAAATVEEIAARADVAPRTFFRYFPTKEAVLYHDAGDVLRRLLDRVRSLPATEPPHRSLLAACTELGEELTADTGRMQLLRRLAAESPRLVDYYRVLLLQQFEDEIVGALARHHGMAHDDLSLRAATAALLSSLGVAFRSWVDDGAADAFRPYVTAAIDACRPVYAGD